MSPVPGKNITKPLIEQLHHLELFRQFSKADLAIILECLEEEHHEMGKILFQIGEPFRKSLFILYRGRVGLWGPKEEKYEVDPGAILGLSNYMDGLPYTFTAIALTPISLLVVREAEHHELERLCPLLYKKINQSIAGQIRSQHPPRQSFVGSMTRPAKAAMKSPLTTCGPDISLSRAYHLMDERKIGSLVVIGQEGELLGVLTYAGLAEAMVKGADPGDNVMKVACETAYVVSSETPLWEIEEVQHQHALKYVIVTEGNRPIGMISQTDILRNLLSQRGGVRDEVRSVESFPKLLKLTKRMISIVADAREHNHRASAAIRVISEFHLSLLRRSVELIIHEMAKNDRGPPPAKFAVLIMGSGGRKEMLLNPEQNNGIIIDDPAKGLEKKARRWFKDFAEQLNQRVVELGYGLSQSDITVKNPMFHKTLEEWFGLIDEVAVKPGRKSVHWFKLFLDHDTLYGDETLTESLRGKMMRNIKENPGVLDMLVEDNAKWRPPLGFFNQLIPMGFFNDEGGGTAKGKIDIKKNGLRILVDVLRIYALRAGLRNRNTMERLMGLVRQGQLKSEYANSIRVAYEALVDMLLVHQLQQAESGKRLDKLIKSKQLSATDQETLRLSMRIIKDFQEKLQTDFKSRR